MKPAVDTYATPGLSGARARHEKMDKSLRRLLHAARHTVFGEQHEFVRILAEGTGSAFHERVPLADYASLKPWWEQARAGAADICWPGRISYFATSSGTTEGRQKYIPVSGEMIRAMNRGYRAVAADIWQQVSLRHLATKALCIGSSSRLFWNGAAWEGDISGISAARMPGWFDLFYKPGRAINRAPGWPEKLEQIVTQAPRWNIGTITGLPSWVLQVLQAVVERYRLTTIHELWPELRVFSHSGMPYAHYHAHFQGLLGWPLLRFETLTASEGVIGLPVHPNSDVMRLLTGNGIFFEFIPFSSANFDETGQPKAGCTVCTAAELANRQPYALVLSTCSGLWRYVMGDVIEFENAGRLEFRFAGRTAAWLNLTGEKVSEGLMAKGIGWLNDEMDARILEFSILPGAENGTFYHHWLLGTATTGQEQHWATALDHWMCEANIDYETERKHHLGPLQISVVPPVIFSRFLALKGDGGGQRKIPRVLREKNLDLFRQILCEGGYSFTISTISHGNQGFTPAL